MYIYNEVQLKVEPVYKTYQKKLANFRDYYSAPLTNVSVLVMTSTIICLSKPNDT